MSAEYSLEDNKKERLEMGLTHMCTVGSSPRRRSVKGRCERAAVTQEEV